MTDPSALLQLVGRALSALHRIYFTHGAEVYRTAGGIEMTFADGATYTFDSGPDGEALAIKPGMWLDPFRAPLDATNTAYVRQHGKWTRFDVSGEEPYSALIGQAVEGVVPLTTPEGKLVGATITVGAHLLRIEVGADELIVNVV